MLRNSHTKVIINSFYYFFIILLLFVSCKKEDTYQTLQGNALGTGFTIKYKGNINFTQAIDSLFNVVNHSLSTYHPNSIISRINKGDTTVIADQHFINVFTKAKRIYKETGGFFDPTVGALVNAYGFGPGKPINDIDSTRVIDLMQLVGFNKVHLINNKIQKDNPKIFIDFNAIAKGYAIDVIGYFFESNNIHNYMVEVGGEIRAKGKNQQGKIWKIGIEKPLTDGSRAIETTVELNNQSMATSGNYRKFRIDSEGRKFVHTINPKTGFSAKNDLLSASVIAKGDCADVDAYATSFMAMGFQKTVDFLAEHPNLKSVLIYVDTYGNTQIYNNY